MKRLLVASLAMIALASGSAVAADLPVAYKAPPPPPPAPSWTGCYLNAGGGGGIWDSKHNAETYPGLVAITALVNSGGQGWMGVAGGGCDYQFSAFNSNFVIGAFADYDFMDLQGTNEANSEFVGILGDLWGSEKESAAWYVGGRIGYLVTPLLLTYFDGGYTETRFDQVNFSYIGSDAPYALGLPAHTYQGWFIGGGTEYALTFLPIPGLFWRNEYRYASYQAADIPIVYTATGAPTDVAEHVQPYVQTFTTSLVWRFNWAGPVVARY